MTKNDDRKRRVRARMAKTGESYTAARAQLVSSGQLRDTTDGATDSSAGHELHPEPRVVGGVRSSGELAAAFERARTLAVGAGADAVNPMHLLVALSLTPNSIARDVLVGFGLRPEALAAAAEAPVPGGTEREDIGLSVSARTALEFARAEHPGWRFRRSASPPTADELRAALRRPLRTGEVLLGLLREASVTAVVPRLDTHQLEPALRAALDSDAELPKPWSEQPRFAALSPDLREALSELDPDVGPIPPALGRTAYQQLVDEIEALPPHRKSQPASVIWQAAKSRVCRAVDDMPRDRVCSLTTAALAQLLTDAVEEIPEVIRARRWRANQEAER